jgi:hypothetical protein
MVYDHTQRAWLLPAITLPIVAVSLGSVVLGDSLPGVVWVLVLVGVAVFTWILITFSSLRARVGAGVLAVAFGAGWPRRRVALDRVESVRIVRNRWWYGFGIRLIPGGWLWNVWGLDAVELSLDSGKVFRIGSDEPEQLAAAIALAAGRNLSA